MHPVTESPPARRLLGPLLFMLAAVVVLGLALLSRFHGFNIYDDAYMFVRYADHLLAGEGMVWNVGEGPVYGATSLAYVLAVIPFRLIFPDNAAAAIFTTSFFWGLVFLGLVFRLALKTMGPKAGFKPFVAGLIFLVLMSCGVSLRAHFASGMETTFVMAYLSLCLIQWERLRQGQGTVWMAALTAGCAWWVRPDLLIFTLGVPAMMALMGRYDAEGKVWLRMLLVTIGCTVVAVVLARVVAGAWLPLSFYAKSTGIYGPAFAAEYKGLGIAELVRFVARAWPVFLILGMGVYVKWSRLRDGYSRLDVALMGTAVVFTVYFTFFVMQVMGFGQRFFYPLLPVLIYLGIREVLELPENLRKGPRIEFRRIPVRMERIGMLLVAAGLLYYGVNHGRMFREARLEQRFAVFSAEAAYRSGLTDYWVKLDQVAKLPSSLSIGTTEVGMPAALCPDHTIYDLAGLNHAALLRSRLSADALLQHCSADLIYMPHDHYQKLRLELMNSGAFRARYHIRGPKEVKGMMGVAIRNDSPYAGQLETIFGP